MRRMDIRPMDKKAFAFIIFVTLMILLSPVIMMLIASKAHAIDNPIGYTSAPRNMTPAGYWEDSTALQHFSDVGFLTQGFQPSDLKIRNVDGTDTVVYNCTNPMRGCAAQEMMPSPDGKRLAFSVTFGTLVTEGTVQALRAPITSKLYIYDIAAKQYWEVPFQPAGSIARTPDWIDDNTLVAATNWENVYPARMQFNCHQGTYADGRKRGYNNGACASITYGDASVKSLQIWRLKIDGTAQKNLTPQEQNAVRPRVLHHPINKGRIVYSSFQDQEDRCWYQGSSGMGTCLNRWWLMTIANDGTSPTVFAGGHHSPVLYKVGMGAEEFVVMRAVGETPDGKLCYSNYYRTNHMGGMGSILCASLSVGDFQVEGCKTVACLTGNAKNPAARPTDLAQYIPKDLGYIAPFGVGLDNNQAVDVNGKALGKMAYPYALKNGHMMATWGRGRCYNQQGSNEKFDGTTASLGGEPICDMNIAELLVPVVKDPHNPAEMKVLIGSTTAHEFDAVEIIPRPVTHVQPPLDETKGCYLEVGDLRNAELTPLNPVMEWNMRSHDVGIQGNTVKPQDPSFHHDNVKALAIYGVKLHTTYYPNQKWKDAVNYTGWESVWKIGQQPMLSDGSLKMKVPCGQPLYMAAVDSEGKWITHDPWLHSLQPGETKTCFGCHDGHSVERRLEIGMEPQAFFAGKLAASTTPPLLAGHKIVSMADVGPIIEKSCSGCHEGFKNDSLLWSRVFADQEQLDFTWMKKMKSHNGEAELPATCVAQPWRCYSLPRPYWTGLVGRYPRQSMLVWVMEGKRLDGHTNEELPDDQDYPTGHPVVPVTKPEIRTVVDFIQQGAPMVATSVPGC